MAKYGYQPKWRMEGRKYVRTLARKKEEFMKNHNHYNSDESASPLPAPCHEWFISSSPSIKSTAESLKT